MLAYTWLVRLASCALFLSNELSQLLCVGPGNYFRSIWNRLDLAAFGLELVAAGSWLARASDETAVRGLLAVAALLLLVKTMYFARGFPQWGPLVRMLITILDDMTSFFLILLVFVASFGTAFAIYNADLHLLQPATTSSGGSGGGGGGGGDDDYDDYERENDDGAGDYYEGLASGTGEEEGSGSSWAVLEAVLFVVDLAVFGEKTSYLPPDREKVHLHLPPRSVNTALFVCLMVIVNIILLNLLIAIMADSCESSIH